MTLRTWDRIRAGEWNKLARPIEWVRDPVVVLGDEVAQMILDGMKPEFPVCAPPWDDFVIEMQPSPWPISVTDQRDGKHLVIPTRLKPTDTKESIEEVEAESGWDTDFATGVLLSFTNMTERYMKMPFLGITDRVTKDGIELMKAVHEAGGWILGLEMFADLPGGVLPIYWTAVVISSDGSMSPMGSAWSFISQRTVQIADREGELHVHESDVHVEGVGDVIGPPDPEWVCVEALLEAGMMVVSMINCSNVGMDDETPSYPRPARRRLERKGKPLVTFKRLHIKPHKSHAPSGEHIGGGVAIHIARGHFKTYTAERPLLGKHVGTYWWNAELRGTDQKSYVIKDYEVEKGGEEK